jgi:hypothetical protein
MSSKSVQGWWLAGVIVCCGWVSLSGCSSSSPVGAEGQGCFPNDTCNAGLTCASKLCVKLPGGGGGAGGSTSMGGNAGTTSTDGAGGSAGGAGGSAGGASGTMGGASGTMGGARGGAGGAVAGAGGGGVGGSGGASGAGGSLNCNATSTYGPITFASAAQIAVARGTGPSPDEVDWDAAINTDVMPDVLAMSLVAGIPPFLTGITAMDAIDLSGQDNYRACGACVLLVTHADPNQLLLRSGDDYIATSGTLKLTAVPSLPLTAISRVIATMTNVTFKHVSINPTTGVTTDLDDCKLTLSSANLNVIVGPDQ